MTAPAFAQAPEAAIASPCIGICLLKEAPGGRGASLCRGCGRTAAEIGAWLSLTPEARAAIMAQLPARKGAAPVDFVRYSDV